MNKDRVESCWRNTNSPSLILRLLKLWIYRSRFILWKRTMSRNVTYHAKVKVFHTMESNRGYEKDENAGDLLWRKLIVDSFSFIYLNWWTFIYVSKYEHIATCRAQYSTWSILHADWNSDERSINSEHGDAVTTVAALYTQVIERRSIGSIFMLTVFCHFPELSLQTIGQLRWCPPHRPQWLQIRILE